MCPTPGQDCDLVLQTSGSATVTPLILVRRDGVALYKAARQPELPGDNLKVRQASWHRGFGGYLYRPNDPARYAYTNGVDCRFQGGAQPAPSISSRKLDFLIRNMDAEDDNTTGWTTANGAVISNVSTNPRAGSRNFEVVYDGTAAGQVYQSLANPTVLQGRRITFRVYVRSSVAVLAFISDGVGTTSAAHSGGGSYELLSVTRTIDAAATFVRVEVRSGDATTAQIDGGWIEPHIGGGATVDSVPYAMAQYSNAAYAAVGPMVCVWDETNDVLDCVLFSPNAFTTLGVHGSFIYAGTTSSYWTSNDTTDPRTTWTNRAPTGGSDFLLQAQDRSGDLRLFRLDLPNTVYIDNLSTPAGAEVTNTDWNATTFTVGETDKPATGVYSVFDSVLVGKQDGLYYFYAPDNRFRSATDQFRALPNAENFQRGSEYIDGWFYTVMARYGLVRLRFEGGDVQFQQVDPRYQAPAYDRFGGRIGAIVHDGMWLYAIQDQGVANVSATKSVTLMVASHQEGYLTWHTLHNITLGDVRGMFIADDTSTTPSTSFLWIFGRWAQDGTNYQATFYRMRIPSLHENPLKDVTVSLATSGTMVTEIFDFDEMGFGEDDKGWLKVVVFADSITANQTLTVERQIDNGISDSGSWTGVGSAISSTTQNAATVSFTVPTTAKRCRLRITFASNVATAGPVLRGVRIESAAHPDRYWIWDTTVTLNTNAVGPNGTPSGQTAQNILANLDTLDAQDFPLLLDDLDKTQYYVQMVSMDKVTVPPSTGPQQSGEAEHLEEAVRLILRQTLRA